MAASAATPAGAAEVTTRAATTCSATGVKTTTRYIRQLPKVPQAKALTILRAAASCDAATLTALATKDRTQLSFGGMSAKEALALPDKDGRYRALVLLLTRTRPVPQRVGRQVTYVWPRVSRGDNDRAAWNEAVAAGLITAKDVAEVRRLGMGYIFWRAGIDSRGVWTQDVQGD